MQRCLQLAKLGAGFTAPNPMVGAVLVYNNKIIGEGYHQQYGGPHAEVNCIASVNDDDKKNIPFSTIYVSLEPCAHFGKTPPCADLIIKEKIPNVVVGCRDPFTEVDGKGIEKLKAAGVNVQMSELEDECIELNKRFFTFHTQHRPYIILKWAQTADGFIGNNSDERMLITNENTNRLVHTWRSEEAAILIGTNTAMKDDPQLNTRLVPGRSPVRMVLDMNLRLSEHLKIFDGTQKTIVLNGVKDEQKENIIYRKIGSRNLVADILNVCYHERLLSVIIEGGAKMLQTFIDAGVWDEARIITNTKMFAGNGVKSPSLPLVAVEEMTIDSDKLCFYFNKK